MLRRYLAIGTSGRSERDVRRVEILNGLAAISFLNTLVFVSIAIFLGSDFLLINASVLFSGALFLIAPSLHRFGMVVAALYFLTVLAVAITLWTFAAGLRTGSHYFLLAAPPMTVLLLGHKRWPLETLLSAICVAQFLALEKLAPDTSPYLHQPEWFLDFSFTWAIGTAAAVLLGTAYFAFRRAETAEDALELEHQRSENLLVNLVPATIAEQLKASPGTTIAEQFDAVTILFADIVDFTPRAERLPPHIVVQFLNQVFSEFDRLVAFHSLEKIKTIGDAYMVAGGLPDRRPGHLEAVANMALDMLHAADRFSDALGEKVQIRIGISTGPAIAGVIGTRKLFYDVWGDTANTAARMESHGTPGRIQVTPAVRSGLESAYLFEDRGPVNVKGKGEMALSYLVGRKPESLDAA
ncbi:adenylate/guanylate cyclase domain-containing protein [Aquibium sp. LZ166]|uniref:Adenylate/guanylate cyclase domain-containing protein n=1 Tax=Aquibium pacificus TaxID=3153579 RepID=A0ABV3SLM5_9HYPH